MAECTMVQSCDCSLVIAVSLFYSVFFCQKMSAK